VFAFQTFQDLQMKTLLSR